MPNQEGTNIGEICNRNGCCGTIYLYRSKDYGLGGCSCHIGAPCSYCEESIEENRCNSCDWAESDEDITEYDEFQSYHSIYERKYKFWIKDNLPKIEATFIGANDNCEYKVSGATCVIFFPDSIEDLENLKKICKSDIDLDLIVLKLSPIEKVYYSERYANYGEYLRGVLPTYLVEKTNMEFITAQKIQQVTDYEMEIELKKWENELEKKWGVAKYFDNHFDGWSCRYVNKMEAQIDLEKCRKLKGYLICYYIRDMGLPYQYTNSQ